MTDHQVVPLKTIGILGGMSNVATVNYYKGINQRVNELMGGYNIAEIIMHSVNFANIEAFVRGNQWTALTRHRPRRGLERRCLSFPERIEREIRRGV